MRTGSSPARRSPAADRRKRPLQCHGRYYASHSTTVHSAGQYVDPTDRANRTNKVECYFSIFKRGMKGVYQHCDKKHLHRYMAEFDFRYSNRAKLGVDDESGLSRRCWAWSASASPTEGS